MKVLIVDDDQAMAKLLRKAIQGWGYSAETVYAGKEAIEKLTHQPFDLVLLDIFLPDGQGHRLIPRMRNLRSGVGIIAITGYNARELEIEVRKMGIDQYMSKPLDMDLLRMSLDHVARRNNAMNEDRAA